MKTEKLGNIIGLTKGKKHQETDDNNAPRYLQIEDINGNNNNHKFTFEKGVLVQTDDIILAWDGANAGKVGTGLTGIIGSTLARMTIDKQTAFPKYIYWFLHSKFDYIKRQRTGATIPHVSNSAIRNLLVPLPQIPDQQRIATILDHADAICRKNREILEKYHLLAQCVFFEMFGDLKLNPKKFELKELDEVCLKVNDGEHGTVIRKEEGYLYLMARNIRDNFIDLSQVDHVSESDHKRIFKRCNPQKGDVLLVCVGATIGRLSIVPRMEEFSLARSVALLKPDYNQINSQFLYAVLNSNYGQDVIKSSRNTSAQTGLYIGKIKKIRITIPPMILQDRFAEIIEKINK